MVVESSPKHITSVNNFAFFCCNASSQIMIRQQNPTEKMYNEFPLKLLNVKGDVFKVTKDIKSLHLAS